jgi:hypothetical protein
MCCRIKSFCCFEVATAAVILGWVGLTGSIILVVIETILLHNIDEFKYSAPIRGIDMDVGAVMGTVFGLDLAFNIMNLLTSGFLVLGAIKVKNLLRFTNQAFEFLFVFFFF